MNNGQLAKELTPACRVSLTRWLPLVLALAIQAVCFSSYAVEFHDHDDILAVAEKLVLKLPEIAELNQPYVSMDRLDSRLRLKQCSQPLRAEPSPGGVRTGKTTIAYQIAKKLWKNKSPHPKTLFLVDRKNLLNQAMVNNFSNFQFQQV